MICRNVPRSASVRTLVVAALFAIGLAATTPVPALAGNSPKPPPSGGSGTWATTGSLNIARSGHTATLLASGQVLVVGGGGFLETNLKMHERNVNDVLFR
jgi:hypothetical protein